MPDPGTYYPGAPPLSALQASSAGLVGFVGAAGSSIDVRANVQDIPRWSADGSAATPGIAFAADLDTGLYRAGANALGIATGGVARLLINADGTVHAGDIAAAGALNLRLAKDPANEFQLFSYVGQTASSSGTVKAGLGLVFAGAIANLNGAIEFSRGGSAGDGHVHVRAGGAERLRIESGGTVRPGADNAQSSGAAAHRWTVLFASTGSINTSDAREKVWRSGFSEQELRAGLRVIEELGAFQWIDAVAEKGDNARVHFGARAQRVWAIFAEEGLCDPLRPNGRPGATPQACLCYDRWEAVKEPIFEDVETDVEEVAYEPTDLVIEHAGETVRLTREVRRTVKRMERRDTGRERVKERAGDRFGVRIDQLHSLMIASLDWQRRQQDERIARLEEALLSPPGGGQGEAGDAAG